MSAPIQVGMADLKTARAPHSLVTSGLGSCVGVCLWDEVTRVGGMAHVMLPSDRSGRPGQNPAKFADSAIALLVTTLLREGARQERLRAKIAGGAQMFAFAGQSDIMNIGARNVAAVEEELQRRGIRLVARDTGGNYGRTIVFHLATAALVVRTIGHGERVI